MGDVPWSMEAFMSTILAHWSHPDAVLHFNAANLQRCEELGDGLSRRLRLDGRSGSGILLWGEEGDTLGSLVVNWLMAFDLLFGCRSLWSRDRDAMMRMADSLGEVCRHIESASDGLISMLMLMSRSVPRPR